MPPWLPPVLAVVVYVVLSFFVYGLHSPLSNTSLPECGCGDVAQEVSFLAWPAHALAQGHNPFFTDYLNYPRGVNLMQNTSMPLLAVVFAPVTLLIGPAATFNLLVRLAFVLSATSMLFVLRRWTRWWPAAFVGGLVYGFCPFMIGQAQGHLFLTFVPLPPLIVLLLDTLLRTERSPLRTGALLGLVCAAQLLISAEILAITISLVAVGLVALAIRHPVATLERWRVLLLGGGAAAGVFLLVAGYPLWVYAAGPAHITGPPHPASELRAYHSDPSLLVQPSPLFRIGFGSWQKSGRVLVEGNGVEQTDYVGIPLLVLLAVLAVRARRIGMAQLAVGVGFVAWVLTLGPHLWFRGAARHITLPFSWVLHVPVLNGVLDVRFSYVMYACIAILLAVSLDALKRDGWLPGSHRRPRGHPATRATVVLGLTAAALVPLVPVIPYTATQLSTPAVLASPAAIVPDGGVLVGYPSPGGVGGVDDQLMLWQAMGGWRYKIIGARAAAAGPDGRAAQGAARFLPPPDLQDLLSYAEFGKPSLPPADSTTYGHIRQVLTKFDVDTVVVVPIGQWQLVDNYLTAAIGSAPVLRSGAYVWTGLERLRAH